MPAPNSPDPGGSEYSTMQQSETLDEDDIGVDPLEAGMDPAEGWSGADRYGTAPGEQGVERPIDERLAEERSDVGEAGGPPVSEDTTQDGPAERIDARATARPAYGSAVPVGDEFDATGESATRRAGHLNREPDQAAADEAVRSREE